MFTKWIGFEEACVTYRHMELQRDYYIQKLQACFANAQRKNPSYSLRSYAKSLGMHSSTLSLVLKGKRFIPKKDFESVVSHLKLSPKEETLFRESMLMKKTKIDQIEIHKDFLERDFIEESQFSILSEWEHYAVLSLIETEDFVSCEKHISKRLGISENRANLVLNNLLNAELISKNKEGKINISTAPLRTTEDINSRALIKSHEETLEMAITKLKEIDVKKRDFSSMTLSVDPNLLPEAKTIIREFRKKFATLMKQGTKKDVYNLSIQLFPFTEDQQGN